MLSEYKMLGVVSSPHAGHLLSSQMALVAGVGQNSLKQTGFPWEKAALLKSEYFAGVGKVFNGENSKMQPLGRLTSF